MRPFSTIWQSAREAAGAYPDALAGYRAAHDANPKKNDDVSASIDRVGRLMLARADDEEIARRRAARR